MPRPHAVTTRRRSRPSGRPGIPRRRWRALPAATSTRRPGARRRRRRSPISTSRSRRHHRRSGCTASASGRCRASTRGRSSCAAARRSSEQDLIARLNDLGYAQRAAGRAARRVRRSCATRWPSRRASGDAGRQASSASTFPARRRRRRRRRRPPPRAASRQIEVVGERQRADAVRARSAAADGADDERRAREAPRTCRSPRSRSRCSRRCSPSRTRASTPIPAINPFRLVAAARHATSFGSERPPVGYSTITQQLARMFFLADEFNAELQSGERGRTLGSYLRKARERHDVAGARAPRVEGRDPRAVSQRRLPRAARLVRHPRRRRGVAHLLRQGRRQPQHQRGGADRRRHPEPGAALAVRQPEARRRAPQRGAARDGGRGVHHRRTRPSARSREPLQVVAARRRQRGAVLRRHGQPAGRRGVSRA